MRTNTLVGLRVFLSHNRMFVFLCGWVYLFTALGVVCARRCDTVCTFLSLAPNGFLSCFGTLSLVAVGYMLICTLATVFLFGTALVLPLVSLAGLAVGFCGYSSVYVYGWHGLLANAVVCLPISALFMFYVYHATRCIHLSLSMGEKLFGKSGNVFFITEVKRYLILFAVMTAVSVALSAAVSALTVVFEKFL